MKLGDICDIQSGGTPSRSKNEYWFNGTIPWVKISDINSKFVNNTEEYITDIGLKNSSAKIFPKGTIIYTIFATIGEVAILNCDACTNQAIAGLKIIDKNISKEYLYHYLVQKKEKVKASSRGVAQNNINLTMLRALEIDIPKVSEQQKKANALNKICALIDSRKIQLSRLDQLAKSRFIEMFGDPILNPMGWAISHYGDEFEIMSGGTPKTDIPEYWVNGKISWIGSNLCQNSVLIENDGKFITEKGLNNSSAKIFNKGYILIALVGATIGKVAHLKFSTSTNQNIAGINVPQNENYIPEFVFYNTQFLYPKFMDIGNSKFKMANLSFIRSLQIPIVPIKAQKKFSNFVEQLDKSKFRIKKSLEKLEMIYKALLQEYFG